MTKNSQMKVEKYYQKINDVVMNELANVDTVAEMQQIIDDAVNELVERLHCLKSEAITILRPARSYKARLMVAKLKIASRPSPFDWQPIL